MSNQSTETCTVTLRLKERMLALSGLEPLQGDLSDLLGDDFPHICSVESDGDESTKAGTDSPSTADTPSRFSSSESLLRLTAVEEEVCQRRDQALIIFDWDDTLCPTSYVDKRKSLTERQVRVLETHEEAVLELLQTALELGQVKIVTMAMPGWVEESCKQLMPRVSELLERLQIEVVLARGEKVGSGVFRQAVLGEGRDASQYLKTRVMRRTVKDFLRKRRPAGSSSSRQQVLSIGDATSEQLALQDVFFRRDMAHVKDCYCKTMRLWAKPSLRDLTALVSDVRRCLPAMVHFHDDFHLVFDEGGKIVPATVQGP
eukprot:TRINITY_DN66209_c0_g1_i1.p1 TRINITY_DN66209_c0_g1~~TRINITY_DN66209_c0_g1_i1.p1  ORF type:complete len:316 (+),score=68.56 TRINITY_DN66209_c0_g1_i1:181-1128(+)